MFLKESTFKAKKKLIQLKDIIVFSGIFLARLRRKTKCYTKALYMLIYSVKLLMVKWNKNLSILF
ncbi:hypothetical protein MSIBF_A2620013 [groundwater metagenome]|uniref:Uncharacterized protein n=1 Tax=groundwater metagenome TaxID=717931 RepID=A0A098E9K2_9ZZZZ